MQPRPWRDHLAPGTAVDPDDLTAAGSLTAAWAARWAADPARPVLFDAGGWADADHGRWVSAGELDGRTRAAAARWAGLGLGPGDRVLWSMGSSLAAVVAHVGALRAGLVVVPANTLYTGRELAHIVSDVRPAAAVLDDAVRVQWPAEADGADVPVLGPDAFAPGEARGATGGRGSGLGADGVVLDGPGADAPALIAYTSGTTGAPKGAVLSHRNILANSESVARTWRWGEADRLVHALPVFHGHGLCVALYTTLLTGSSAVLLPSFDVAAVLDAAADHRASMFFGVPTMFHRLASSGRAGELARLRLVVSGSAPLPPTLHRELARAGSVVLERYGMTETLMTLSNPYEGVRRAGTVGFPFPGVDAWVGPEPPDAAAGVAPEPGEGGDGEIFVRGPTVFGGYWQRPAESAERLAPGGWLHTGDLAGVDADGYVTVRGRLTEMVISGGYNVYPAEVEDVLLGHPAVAEVAVTGTPSDEWGEVVTAWVVPDGPAPAVDDLLAYAAGRLAPYKRPRLVRFVDSLPRNALGKVRRGELG